MKLAKKLIDPEGEVFQDEELDRSIEPPDPREVIDTLPEANEFPMTFPWTRKDIPLDQDSSSTQVG